MPITLDVPPDPIPQGAVLQGRVVAELAGEALAACHLELRFSPGAFSAIHIDGSGFAQAGDAFDFSVDDNGVCAIAGIAVAPLTGSVALVSFTAQVDGLRGDVYAIRATMLSATSPDLVPLDLGAAEVSILVASGAPGIATSTLPDAHAGEFYAERVIAEGGQPPYAFSASGLPAGLTLDAHGVLSGTPAGATDATLSVHVTDAATPLATASGAIPLRVTAVPPVITIDALPDCAPGHVYDVVLTATGGLAPLTWSATGLPAGLQVQGDRITGTVDLAAPLGSRPIRIGVRDAELNAQHAVRELAVNLLPILAVQRIDLPSPAAVVVGRDLFVAEYEIDVSGSASSTYEDEATEETLTEALDDVMTAIFEEMFGSGFPGFDDGPGPGGPGLPGDPDNPFPGEPGEEPAPPSYVRPGHERLNELLQTFRWLDAQLDPNIMKFGLSVSVEIDGRHAYTWSNVDFGKFRKEARRAAPLPRRSAKHEALRKDLAKHRQLWLRYAVGETRSAMHKRARKKAPPGMTGWQNAARVAFDERLQTLLDIVGARDWDWWQKPAGQVLSLTPGHHRVRLTPTIHWTLSGDSITGAMEMASAQAAMRATFRARNPQHWPRLEGTLVVDGVCRRSEYIEQDVLFPNSALDVVCNADGALQLLPATGDPATPFAEPRPFSVAVGINPSRLAAGVADEFGRTWLVASQGRTVVIARNKGIGGFARLDLPELPSAAGAIRQIQVLPTSSWGAIAVLQRRGVVVIHALKHADDDPPQPVSVKVFEQAFRSSVAHDESPSFAVYRTGGRAAFFIVDSFSGQVTRSPLKLPPPEIPAVFHPAYAEVRILANPVALALDDTGDETRGVVAFRQRRRLEWFTLNAGSPSAPWQPPAHAIAEHVDLAAPPVGMVAGPGRGLTVLVEPDGQLLYRDAASRALFLVLKSGQVSRIAATEGTLAASLQSEDAIVILRDLRLSDQP